MGPCHEMCFCVLMYFMYLNQLHCLTYHFKKENLFRKLSKHVTIMVKCKITIAKYKNTKIEKEETQPNFQGFSGVIFEYLSGFCFFKKLLGHLQGHINNFWGYAGSTYLANFLSFKSSYHKRFSSFRFFDFYLSVGRNR